MLADQQLVACTQHDWMSEQGSIEIGSRRLKVVKHGMASGKWTIEDGGDALVTAFKPNPLTRRFELSLADDRYELAAWTLSRCFDLKLGASMVASIAPDHPFTRRSTIRTEESLPLELTTFAFWLAVLCWRRVSKTAGAS